MGKERYLIPANGKMTTSTFGSQRVVDQADNLEICLDIIIPSDNTTPNPKFSSSGDLTEIFNQTKAATNIFVWLRRFQIRNPSGRLKLEEFLSEVIQMDEHSDLKKLALHFLLFANRHSRLLQSIFLLLERNRCQIGEFKKYLNSNKYTKVISPSMGAFGFEWEARFALAAQSLGLPVYSVITNYDNLTNRGRKLFMPDKLAVWGEQMAIDAHKLHGIPYSKIEKIGAPQFDKYFLKDSLSKLEYLSKIRLDSSRPTILYAGPPSAYQTLEVLKTLIDLGYTSSHNIIFRPYPNRLFWSDPIYDCIRTCLSEFDHSHVGLSFDGLYEQDSPDYVVGFDSFEAAEEDKARSLRHSNVMINHFSTISLEAAAVDLPFIQIGFGKLKHFLKNKFHDERMRNHDHNVRDKRMLAGPIANSPKQLQTLIDLYTKDNTVHAEDRMNYAKCELEFRDENGSRRLLDYVRS